MKLYYWPGTCSITIHILLEETGAAYQHERIDLSQKQQYSPDYLAINPKGKVPALIRDDGSLLTEVPAIAHWLAITNPSYKLLPADIETQTRALEFTSYIAGTVHMQGAARAWRPLLFGTHPDEQSTIVARGKEIVMAGLELADAMLRGRDYVLGEYSIADASLFFIEYWAAEKVHYPLPGHVADHYQRMRERPAVQRALAAEGLD